MVTVTQQQCHGSTGWTCGECSKVVQLCRENQDLQAGGMAYYRLFFKPDKWVMLDLKVMWSGYMKLGRAPLETHHNLVGSHGGQETPMPPIWVSLPWVLGTLRSYVHQTPPCSISGWVLLRMHPLRLSHLTVISVRWMCERLISPSRLSSHRQDYFIHKGGPPFHTVKGWGSLLGKWGLLWL